MRKQLKTKVEIGDENYVAPGEFFLEIGEDNKVPTALKRRKDDLTMETILGSGSGDDSKAFRLDLTKEQIDDIIDSQDVGVTQITSEIFADLSQGKYDSIIVNFAITEVDPETGYTIDYDGSTTLPILGETTRTNLGIPDYFDGWVIAGDSYEPTSILTSEGLGFWWDEKDDACCVGICNGRCVIGCIPAPYIDTATGTASGNNLLLNMPINWANWIEMYRATPPMGRGGKGIIIDGDFYPFYTRQQMQAFIETTHYEPEVDFVELVGNWSGDKTTGHQCLITLSLTDKKLVLVNVTNWDENTGQVI